MLKLESKLNGPVRSKCSGGITGEIQYNGYYRFSLNMELFYPTNEQLQNSNLLSNMLCLSQHLEV